MTIVTLLSGGLDSTTLLYQMLEAHPDERVCALSFNYGQRHRQRELAAAYNVVEHAKQRYDARRIEHHVIDLTDITRLLGGSALTDDSIAVPDGHYTDESMRVTVVPNRNMLMLSIGCAFAVSQGAHILAFAAHAGDRAVYPDCRESFVDVLNLAMKLGNAGFLPHDFALLAPYVDVSKTDIVRFGSDMQRGMLVPYHLTWSCYKGERLHCGTCGTCVERREAFRDANVNDPTQYETDAIPA